MGLIREINEALEKHAAEQEHLFSVMEEKVSVILESEYHSELFETAEQFLLQAADMIKTGKGLDPAQAKALGAKLAALQLIADPGTRGSALSVIAGEPTKKIATIMKNASGVDQPLGQVDKVLIALANKVGKSGADRNAQMFAGLDKMAEKDRVAKAAEIGAMVNNFRQLEQKIQQGATKPEQQTGQTAPVGA